MVALEDDGIMGALSINIGEYTFDGGTIITPWTVITPEESVEPLTFDCSIEFPNGVNDDIYQEKYAKMLFTVEMVQGNAHVEDVPEDAIVVATPSDLKLINTKINVEKSNMYKNKTLYMPSMVLDGLQRGKDKTFAIYKIIPKLASEVLTKKIRKKLVFT